MDVCGVVQAVPVPVGMATVTYEPEMNEELALFVNVKVRVLPVELTTAVVGDTVMVPLPLEAA